MTRLF